MLTSLVCALAIASTVPAQDAGVDLQRVFAKGEKATYDVKSSLQVEFRQVPLRTFLPQDLDIHYQFSTEVIAMKADGICDMRYRRPSMTEVQGETPDSPSKSKTEKVDIVALLTMSPINEVLGHKDESPKKSNPKKSGGGVLLAAGSNARARTLQDVSQFIGELYRLALFVGPLDSSLDLNPKLPFDAVKAGDNWKRTVGYSPQKLKDKGQSAVQRIDMVYTYKGTIDAGTTKVHRVTAEYSLDTDAGPWVNQLLDMKPEESGLKSIKLNIKAAIEFDLDLKTRRTLRAEAKSTGGIRIDVTDLPDEPLREEKLKGRTTMVLLPGK